MLANRTSDIKEIFYNIFWQNKACQNLFLLSKEELLDTKRINIEGISKSVSFPRIILSNIADRDDYALEKIKIRNENIDIKAGNSLNRKIDHYTPLVTNFLEGKFGKSLNKIINDIENNPRKLFRKVISVALSNGKNQEKKFLGLLAEYGIIGKHITNFEQLNAYIQKEAINKNLKNVLTEDNIRDVMEFAKGLKDLYLAETYRGLYNSNQLLVNALYDTDDFRPRQHLFSLLFESNIITPSIEEAHVECLNCTPGTYKGVLQIKMNPNKLDNLKCPVCGNNLTYYVPYELNNDIYSIIKQQDGLLLDALLNYLERQGTKYTCNENKLNDIEIDCSYSHNNTNYIVECKMYKLNTEVDRLKSKIKGHFAKLVSDIERLEKQDLVNLDDSQPVLLVNINDAQLLSEVEAELKTGNSDKISQKTKIQNINQITMDF